MKFVRPETGAKELVLAQDQTQYHKLPVALYTNSHYPGATEMVCRLQLNDEERALVFGGSDLYISQLVFQGHHFAPIQVSVGEGQFRVSLVDEEGG